MNSKHGMFLVRRNTKTKVNVYRDVEYIYNRNINQVAPINENVLLDGIAGKTSCDKLLDNNNEESLHKELKPILIMLRLLGCFPVYFSKSGKYTHTHTTSSHHTPHTHTKTHHTHKHHKTHTHITYQHKHTHTHHTTHKHHTTHHKHHISTQTHTHHTTHKHHTQTPHINTHHTSIHTPHINKNTPHTHKHHTSTHTHTTPHISTHTITPHMNPHTTHKHHIHITYTQHTPHINT